MHAYAEALAARNEPLNRVGVAAVAGAQDTVLHGLPDLRDLDVCLASAGRRNGGTNLGV